MIKYDCALCEHYGVRCQSVEAGLDGSTGKMDWKCPVIKREMRWLKKRYNGRRHEMYEGGNKIWESN